MSRRYQLITRYKEKGQKDFKPFKKQSFKYLDKAKHEADYWATRVGNEYTLEFTIVDKVRGAKVAYVTLEAGYDNPWWKWEYENKDYVYWWQL